MNKVLVKCSYCNKDVQKVKCEYNRSIKLGRRFYCSLSCSAKHGNILFPRNGNINNFHGIQGKVQDELSPFRYHMKIIRYRAKQKSVTNITTEYLKQLWEEQDGICPYTGWKLVLPTKGVAGWKEDTYKASAQNGGRIARASIDRINSDLGYIKGNVQFVAVIANLAKNSFTDKELLNFCKAVTKNRG
jgi:hypothetical protein